MKSLKPGDRVYLPSSGKYGTVVDGPSVVLSTELIAVDLSAVFVQFDGDETTDTFPVDALWTEAEARERPRA